MNLNKQQFAIKTFGYAKAGLNIDQFTQKMHEEYGTPQGSEPEKYWKNKYVGLPSYFDSLIAELSKLAPNEAVTKNIKSIEDLKNGCKLVRKVMQKRATSSDELLALLAQMNEEKVESTPQNKEETTETVQQAEVTVESPSLGEINNG